MLGNGVKLLIGVSGSWGDTKIMTERERCVPVICGVEEEPFHSPGFREIDPSHPAPRSRRLLQALPTTLAT